LNKKIVLITSGQPSVNPRLVKEADTLAAAGYDVMVIYAYWNAWATFYDRELLQHKRWRAICAGGDPEQQPLIYALSRLFFRLLRSLHIKNDWATARSSWFLAKTALKYPAGLYIAHNLGALPAAVKAARRYRAKVGFDAEDFHRQESGDDPTAYSFNLAQQTEDRYVPQLDYLTASSPLIAQTYHRLYKRPVTTILNVFPGWHCPEPGQNNAAPLKLFWFSQTIGPERGLETAIEAVALLATGAELHLLGEASPGYREELQSKWASKGLAPAALQFYGPVAPDELFTLAAGFDIGLAAEVPVCLNRKLALTNKIFTYMQCGLAVAASNTPAQQQLMEQFPLAGMVYADAAELATGLRRYDDNRDELLAARQQSRRAALEQMNWENESKKFLALTSEIFSKTGE